jgi:phytoene dehydrogenase-like protein
VRVKEVVEVVGVLYGQISLPEPSRRLHGSTESVVVASERHFTSAIPFVLLVQPSLFDLTRAPAGRHTVLAYCHVPNGSAADRLERIERQIERFAPGFRDLHFSPEPSHLPWRSNVGIRT